MISPNHHLFLAPLHGITLHTFRRVFAQHFTGFDLMVAPFITTVHAEKVAESHIKDIAPNLNQYEPCLIPQIIGNEQMPIAQLADAFLKLGYQRVNLNLGCPFAKVTHKKRGCGLLPYPERIAEIVNHVTATVPCRFSLKMRLGLDDPNQILNVLPLIDKAPLDFLVIHPRMGAQGYKGRVDLDTFEKCLGATSQKIIYNGDICTIEQFVALDHFFGDRVAGWMIGRGALVNPFLPSQIKTGSTVDPETACRAVRDFMDDLYQSYCQELAGGPGPVLNRMKELWAYVSHSFDSGQKLWKKVRKAQKFQVYESIIDDFFTSRPIWNPPHGDHVQQFDLKM